MIRRVDHYQLWLAGAGSCHDVTIVYDAGIAAVVQLAAEESIASFPRDMVQHRIPLLDGSGNKAEFLQLAVSVVSELLRLGIPTLVCCSAGSSRSPAVAAWAIASLDGRTPLECLMELGQLHPIAVSPGLWRDLEAALNVG